MPEQVVLAVDQGTSGSICIVTALDGRTLARAYREVPIAYPRPGWVEQDANALLSSTVEAAREAVSAAGTVPAAVGITNQRETVVIVDRATLQPVTPAVVWQCRRSAEICAAHRAHGHENEIREKTGLLLDPYFSATKLEWLMDKDPSLRERAGRGELVALTVDGWLIAQLSKEHRLATDASNASRTLLYNSREGKWDAQLCAMFGVPEQMLPEVVDSAGVIAHTDASTLGFTAPIAGVAGDQQAALFGQGCVEAGMSKNTYGTGSFVLVNAGEEMPSPAAGLLGTVAWQLQGKATYALEGSIFVTGAGLKWLRDQVKLIDSAEEAGPLFDSVKDANGCYFVPALAGLGAPYWDADARGAFIGLTGGVTRAHMVRAVVEAMAFRTRDVIEAMETTAGLNIAELRVDGGASVMDGLCQFQSDLLALPVLRAGDAEATARGAAMLAALGAGLVSSPQEAASSWRPGRRFDPARGERPDEIYDGWKRAVSRVRSA
jgi:glycerol kinase